MSFQYLLKDLLILILEEVWNEHIKKILTIYNMPHTRLHIKKHKNVRSAGPDHPGFQEMNAVNPHLGFIGTSSARYDPDKFNNDRLYAIIKNFRLICKRFYQLFPASAECIEGVRIANLVTSHIRIEDLEEILQIPMTPRQYRGFLIAMYKLCETDRLCRNSRLLARGFEKIFIIMVTPSEPMGSKVIVDHTRKIGLKNSTSLLDFTPQKIINQIYNVRTHCNLMGCHYYTSLDKYTSGECSPTGYRIFGKNVALFFTYKDILDLLN